MNVGLGCLLMMMTTIGGLHLEYHGTHAVRTLDDNTGQPTQPTYLVVGCIAKNTTVDHGRSQVRSHEWPSWFGHSLPYQQTGKVKVD
ncbi:hypothetical protein B0T20DRAFT_419428 [Sordaria brevicollis]|uniref:Secreted protein n=1 Tax=Sordaria brevicollis TaxID=83679 RepID=A0AAE0P912_SORBR|nr:hypothetical protein B0T20DRAFT_419428 [Sordaria brevicollis]